MSTEVLNLELQLLLGAAGGTLRNMLASIGQCIGSNLSYLEGKVLEEVRGAVVLVGLGSRASINPHADRRGLSPGGVLGGNLPGK